MPLFRFQTPEGHEHEVRAADEQTARHLLVSQVYHDDPQGEGGQPYTPEDAERMRQVREERAASLVLVPPDL